VDVATDDGITSDTSDERRRKLRARLTLPRTKQVTGQGHGGQRPRNDEAPTYPLYAMYPDTSWYPTPSQTGTPRQVRASMACQEAHEAYDRTLDEFMDAYQACIQRIECQGCDGPDCPHCAGWWSFDNNHVLDKEEQRKLIAGRPENKERHDVALFNVAAAEHKVQVVEALTFDTGATFEPLSILETLSAIPEAHAWQLGMDV
jgi:hypothetical protein